MPSALGVGLRAEPHLTRCLVHRLTSPFRSPLQIAGVPLPALGFLTYGGMLALSINGATAKDNSDGNRLALQCLATAAATTSLYLMTTLATKCVSRCRWY